MCEMCGMREKLLLPRSRNRIEIAGRPEAVGEAAMLARHANPRVTLAVYAGLTDGAREVAVDKLLSAGFGA